MLHCLTYDGAPIQFRPPQLGAGLVHVLFICTVPPPHDTEQALEIHLVQPPLTIYKETGMYSCVPNMEFDKKLPGQQPKLQCCVV